MRELDRERLDRLIDEMSNRVIRVDVTLKHFDPYFMTLFILFWISSQPAKIKNGKGVAMELIQSGLQTKFKSENSVIRQKISVFCDSQGITHEELLNAVYVALGHEEGDQLVTVEDIKTDRTLLDPQDENKALE